MAGNSMDMKINFDFQAKNLDQIVNQINQIQQAFQQEGKSVGFNDKDIKAYSNSLEILKQNTIKTFDVMNSKASTNKVGMALKQAGVDVNNLQNAMRKLGVNGVSSLDNVSKSATQAKRELGKIGEGLKEISHTFTSALKWNLAYGAINAMSSSLKEAVDFAKELDSTLTDIRIVAGLTKEEVTAFGEEATKLAQKLGSTTSDYTKASLIYFQQGLDLSQVKEMADATVIAANITGESASNMSDYLTAVVNGYGMVADEVMNVVDKLAAVGAATASDFGELSVGMSKVASMAKTAGVPIEKLAAQLSTIISTTREAPESVGTSLKTIYSRMLQFKTGSGTDDEGESFSVPTVEKALEKFNQSAGTSISIFGKDGQLREDMGTVLEELGEKWDKVTDQQTKFGVATALAGTRQMNNLMALLNGWNEYKSAVDVAQNSEGTGWEQNQLFMDSYEGKIKQLKSAEQGLYQNLFSADDMKPFIEGLTTVIKGVSQLTKLFGGLPGILVSLGPLLLTKLSVPISQAVQNVKVLRSTEASKVDENEVKINSLQKKGMVTDEKAKELRAINDEIRKNEELKNSINEVIQARQEESNAITQATQRKTQALENISTLNFVGGKNNNYAPLKNSNSEAMQIVQSTIGMERYQQIIQQISTQEQQKGTKRKQIVDKINQAIREEIKLYYQELALQDESVQKAQQKKEVIEGKVGITSDDDVDVMLNNANIRNNALQGELDGAIQSLQKQYAAQMSVNVAISAGMNLLLNMNRSYSSLGDALGSTLLPSLSLLAYTLLPAIINKTTTLKAVLNSTTGKVGLILTAISALAGVVKYFAGSAERAAEANEEFQESFNQQNSTIAKNVTTLNELSDKYKELAKGVDKTGNNLSLTNEKYEEYKSIISQVSEIMPNLAVKYNAQGEAIGFVVGKLEDLNEEYKKTKQQNYSEILHGEEGNEDNFHERWKINAKQGKSGDGWSNYMTGSNTMTVFDPNDKSTFWGNHFTGGQIKGQSFIESWNLRSHATGAMRKNSSTLLNRVKQIADGNLNYLYSGDGQDELSELIFDRAGINLKEYQKATDHTEYDNRLKQAAAKYANEIQQDLDKEVQEYRNVVIAEFGERFVTKLSDEQFEQGVQLINQMDFTEMSEDEAKDWINNLGDKVKTEKFQTAFQQVFVDAQNKNINELIALISDKKIQESLGLSSEQLADILNTEEYMQNKNAYDNFVDTLNNIDDSQKINLKNFADEIPVSDINDLQESLETLKNNGEDLNNLTLEKLREELERTKKYNEILSQSFSDVSKKMDEVQSAYSTVKDAIRTYNENGSMSIDNLQAILSLKTEYLLLFTNEQGELDLSTEKVKEYVKALKSEMILTKLKEAIEEFIKLSPEEREERVKNTNAILDEADAIQKLITAKATEAAQQDWKEHKKNKNTTDGYKSEEDYVKAYTDYFTDIYNGLNGLFDNTSWDLTSDTNDSDNKKDREDLEKKKKDLEKKQKEAEKQEKELGKKIRSAYKAEEEEVKREKELQEAIEGVADAQQDLVDKQKEYNDLLKKHEVDRYKESIEELTAAMEKLDDVTSAIDSVMGVLGKDDYQKKRSLLLQKREQDDKTIAEGNREYQDLVNSPTPDSSEAMEAKSNAMNTALEKKFQATIDKEKTNKELKNLEDEAQDAIDASNKELLDNTESYFDSYINNIKSAIDSIKGILDDFQRWQQGEISQDDYWTLTALKLENASLSLSTPIEKKDMTELDVTDIDTDNLLSQRKSDIYSLYEYAKEVRAKAREEAEEDRQEEIDDMKEQIADAEKRIVEAQEKVQDCKDAIQEGYIATADAWDAVAEQRESMAETQTEIAELTQEISTLEANLSGTMSSTQKVTEGANTATKAMNVTKQAAEEASKAIENAAKEISSDTSVSVLTEAIVNAVKTAAEKAKSSSDYKLLIPNILWGAGAITNFNTPTNENSTADGLIGAMYGVIMYCMEKAKVLTKDANLYQLYTPNINWGRDAEKNNSSQKNNYYNLIGVMYTIVIACFNQVNIYLGQLKAKQSPDYSLVAPALGKEWDKLSDTMKEKVKTAINELNNSMSDQKIIAPTPDESAWTKFGKDIGVFVSKGIQQGVLNGEGQIVVNNVKPEEGGGKEGAANGTFAAAYEHYNPKVSRRTSQYGVKRSTHVHGGIDYAPEVRGAKVPVYASVNGVVKAIPEAESGGLGNCIKIQDENGLYHLYGHLSSMSVATGTKVKAGQQIGISGSTGNSTGVHVHYEVRGKSGSSKDSINPDSGSISYSEKSGLTIKNKDQYGILQLIASMFGYSDDEIFDGEYTDLTDLSEMEKCIAFTKAVRAKFGNNNWGGSALSDVEIAAIVGNAFQESTYNPNLGSPKGNGAYGAWQWLGDRKKRLIEMYPNSYNTLESQVAYLAYEFTQDDYESKQFQKFKNTKNTIEEKTKAFRKYCERCAEWEANDKRRIKGANDSFSYLKNINKYSIGTKDGAHSGGLAMVGDEAKGKYEYVQTPDGKITKMGEHGAEIVNLPKGTTVFSHSDSVALEKVYGNGLKKLPKYAKGTVERTGSVVYSVHEDGSLPHVVYCIDEEDAKKEVQNLVSKGFVEVDATDQTRLRAAPQSNTTTGSYTWSDNDGKTYSAYSADSSMPVIDSLISAVEENTKAVNENTAAQGEDSAIDKVADVKAKNKAKNNKYYNEYNNLMETTAEPLQNVVNLFKSEVDRVKNLDISEEEKQTLLLKSLNGPEGILAKGSVNIKNAIDIANSNAERLKKEIDEDNSLTENQKNEFKQAINERLTEFIKFSTDYQETSYDILFDGVNSLSESLVSHMEKMNIDSSKIRREESDNIAELENQYAENYESFTVAQRKKAQETIQEAKKNLYENERSTQKEQFSLFSDELKNSGKFGEIAEYYQKDLDLLTKAYKDGVISIEEYQKGLKEINDEFDQLNENQRSRIKSQFDAAISAVNTEFSKLKETLDDQKTSINNYYDLESKITDLRTEKSKEYDTELRRNYDKQIEFLTAQKELYKNEGDPRAQAELMRTINESIKSFDLMVAEDILDKKRNQKVNRIFNQDTQTFDWVEDFDAIAEAEKNVLNVEKELKLLELNNEQERYDLKKEDLEDALNKPQQDAYYEAALRFFGSNFVKSLSSDSAFNKNILNVATVGAEKTYNLPDELDLNDDEEKLFGTSIFSLLDKDYTEETRKLLKGTFYSKNTDYANEMLNATSREDVKKYAKQRLAKSLDMGSNQEIFLRDLVGRTEFSDLVNDKEFKKLMKIEESNFTDYSRLAYSVPRLTIEGRDWLKDVMSYFMNTGLVGQDFADSMNYSTLNSFYDILGKVSSGDNIDSSISKEEIKNITVNVQGLNLNDNEKEVLADTLMKAIERQSITTNK